MLKSKKWIKLQNNSERAKEISEKFNISPLIANVLLNRDIADDEAIENFIRKDESQFCDPFLMTDMKKAVDFIENAINTKRRIAVYGDYDVDGITATYIVYDYLKSRNADVLYYIPDRADEGYGMNKGAIMQLKEKNVELIITVDVGITAVEETVFANECGIDVIITDHHTPKEELPRAIAVINPKISGNKYPNTDLAGVGVAYKLVYALSGCSKDIMKKYSVHASIGTIADMVPLKEENRFIASYGLENIKTTQNAGINALIDVAGIEKSQISSSNISFGLAPRLNAAGRIASASVSVELLLETDKNKAFEIATKLDENNKMRQAQEHDILQEAEEIILSQKLYEDDVIVVAKEGWHHGVIGIVSSKITEKYYKPSAVISINDDGTAKASGRSVAGFNLFDALTACADSLIKFGGHDLAAGFSLETEKIESFRKKINCYAKDVMDEDTITPKLTIDACVRTDDISCKTVNDISILEPFGIGNRTPVFCIEDANVSAVRHHKAGKHIFLTMEKQNVLFDAPAFNMADTLGNVSPGEKLSLAGTLSINSFRGVDSVQFVLKDVKFCDTEFINENNLRTVFVCIKEYINKNTYSFRLSDIKSKLHNENCFLGITRIKTALKIFSELELLHHEITNDTVSIRRGNNFYSKCNLTDSKTFNEFSIPDNKE